MNNPLNLLFLTNEVCNISNIEVDWAIEANLDIFRIFLLLNNIGRVIFTTFFWIFIEAKFLILRFFVEVFSRSFP